MRNFKFDPSMGWKKNEEFVPPPALTNQSLPFNWSWHQNPMVAVEVNESTGQAKMYNRNLPKKFEIVYLRHDVTEIPHKASSEPPDNPPGLRELVKALKTAFNERPIW